MGAVDDLIEDIVSWDNFYIIADEQLGNVVSEFSKRLKSLNIGHAVVDRGYEQSFKEDLDFGDCILVISRDGENEFILDMIVFSKSRNVKVYAICADGKSKLALMASEIIDSREDFDQSVMEITDDIIDMLGEDFEVNYSLEFKSSEAGLIRRQFFIIKSKRSWLITQSRGNIFILVDTQFKDIADKLSDRLKSYNVNTIVIDYEWRNRISKDGKCIEMPNGEMHRIAKENDGIVVICENIGEYFWFFDFVICSERGRRRNNCIVLGRERFRDNAKLFIENLNIEIPKRVRLLKRLGCKK